MVIAETNALNPLIQLQLLRSRGLPKVLTVTDDRGRAHQYGVERVTSARKLARLFEKAGFETELVRHERLFPNAGVAPRALIMLEQLLSFCRDAPSSITLTSAGAWSDRRRTRRCDGAAPPRPVHPANPLR